MGGERVTKNGGTDWEISNVWGCHLTLRSVEAKCVVPHNTPELNNVLEYDAKYLGVTYRATNHVRPKKGTMMAKKKEFIKTKLTTTCDTLPMQKYPFLMLFFPYKQVFLLMVILVLSAFHSFWEYFSLQVCFKLCFLLNLSSNQHFRAVLWSAVCKKKNIYKYIFFLYEEKKRSTVIWRKKSSNYGKNRMVGSSAHRLEIQCLANTGRVGCHMHVL